MERSEVCLDLCVTAGQWVLTVCCVVGKGSTVIALIYGQPYIIAASEKCELLAGISLCRANCFVVGFGPAINVRTEII